MTFIVPPPFFVLYRKTLILLRQRRLKFVAQERLVPLVFLNDFNGAGFVLL
jgi:hypothetical protein